MAGERKLTGWHVLAIFVTAFAVIIGVNLALAYNAIKTFPGVEVKNSYIASQTFDKRRASQQALGWSVSAEHKGGLLILSIKDPQGRPVQAGKLKVTLGRPTHVKDDREPKFNFDGVAYVARESLAPGNWNIRMQAKALDGTPFEQRVVFYVKE